MKIIKLNCVACGAPISVPENMDTLYCSSCGSKLAVDREEGYTTLNLIEKLTKEVQESAEKTRNAIKESSFATKNELKRVQICQSINTEEIKLNATRQETRSLSRKSSLLPVELEQLSLLHLVECDIMLLIRKLNLDSAKLDEGWQDSMAVFKSDLAALDQIIQILKPHASETQVRNRLNELLQERIHCENNLNALEIRLIKKHLKSFQYPPINSLSIDQIGNLEADIQNDLMLLSEEPHSSIKQHVKDEIVLLSNNLQKALPRKRVEAESGLLKSLDFLPPYPEIPWQLIPLIEQVEIDLQNIEKSSESPEKAKTRMELNQLLRELKNRQAMDIPAKKMMAAKRKKRARVFLILFAICLGVVFLFMLFNGNFNKFFKEIDASLGLDQQKSSYTVPAKTYKEQESELFEVVAQKTYFHEGADIQSEETSELKHGEIVINLGQSEEDSDWFLTQNFFNENMGYLYQQWISPVHGNSVKGLPTEEHKTILYKEDFSDAKQDWLVDSFISDSGQGDFFVTNNTYQINLSAVNPGYLYATTDLNNLPQNFTFSINTELLKSNVFSGSGIITNYYDGENFDYFLLTSEDTLVIGCRRNGYSYRLYDTQETPNNKYRIKKSEPNTLSVEVNASSEFGPTVFNFAVNGATIYSLQYNQIQDFRPTIGLIVWCMENGKTVSSRFDDISVTAP